MKSVFSRPRHAFTLGVLLLAGVGLMSQAVYLHTLRTQFLRGEGDARALRTVSVSAHRGMLLDRNGEPLAISAPVDSVWVVPGDFAQARARWPELGRVLGMSTAQFATVIKGREGKRFAYLKRAVPPELADAALALKLPGVHRQRGYRRYYPLAEAAGHVLGFTDIDDRGQAGLEQAYDKHLRGVPGSERIVLDARRERVALLETIAAPQPGRDLKLAIDRRIQYLAYRELKAAVLRHRAASGMAVMVDVDSGEVLAMVNQPTFNPNDRADQDPDRRRNRAVTDPFEPGSTIKPFTVAAAMERGLVRPDTMMYLPNDYVVGRKHITDVHYHQQLTVTEVLQKSSNIGVVKMAMQLRPDELWDTLHRAGFGEKPGSGFPGEVGGRLRDPATWKPVEQATHAYGHGLSVSLLQLARAYMTFANDGVVMPLTFLKREPQELDGERVLSVRVARQVREMMETVTHEGGTATLAKVPGYRVAGKTGTAYKLVGGRYSTDSYISSFVGLAPASDPRLIIAVMIDEPREKGHFGGLVAGPVFAQVMAASLRQLGVSPDAQEEPAARLTRPQTISNPGEA